MDDPKKIPEQYVGLSEREIIIERKKNGRVIYVKQTYDENWLLLGEIELGYVEK